jgi:hypothetical protein
MNALHDEGFVALGGPLEASMDVLLIVRARNAELVAARLADDPWSRNGLLMVKQIHAWTLRLGALP